MKLNDDYFYIISKHIFYAIHIVYIFMKLKNWIIYIINSLSVLMKFSFIYHYGVYINIFFYNFIKYFNIILKYKYIYEIWNSFFLKSALELAIDIGNSKVVQNLLEDPNIDINLKLIYNLILIQFSTSNFNSIFDVNL